MSNGKYVAPNGDGKLRKCDSHGCGHFGAPRGNRDHMGLDFETTLGQIIYAPTDCVVNRHGKVANDGRHDLIELVWKEGNDDFRCKIMYVYGMLPVNSLIRSGGVIAQADTLQDKYQGITEHVHLELIKNGQHVDPAPYFNTK